MDSVFCQTGKTAIIFVGIPGSGKSSYYHSHLSEHYERINLDTLHTRNKENRLLEACIADGKNFVVDNTNPTAMDRQKYIKPAKIAGYRVIALFFQSIVSDCIQRNETRTGKAKIPISGIAAISKKLEIPKISEGFDNMYYVKIDNEKFVLEPLGEME